MKGGCFLAVDHGKKFIPFFKEDYKKSLKKVLDDYTHDPTPINIDICIRGCRDTITKEVEAMDPFNPL